MLIVFRSSELSTCRICHKIIHPWVYYFIKNSDLQYHARVGISLRVTANEWVYNSNIENNKDKNLFLYVFCIPLCLSTVAVQLSSLSFFYDLLCI
jgi:hypothetical protein